MQLDKWKIAGAKRDQLASVCEQRLAMKPLFSTWRAAVRVLAIASLAGAQTFAASFSRPDAKNAPDLFAWTDTCNVYVVRDGAAAVLINLGDDGVLEHLG